MRSSADNLQPPLCPFDHIVCSVCNNVRMSQVILRPGVGVALFIWKDGKVLLGQRLNAHGEGSWGLPGGHLEFGESWEACVRREVAEETGMKVHKPKFVQITNDVFKKEKKHYVTIFMEAKWQAGKPQILEPDRLAQWKWFAWDELPEPLFLPIINLIDSGYSPL